ncbi:hypothetical protein AC629_43100 [Bradyrhizobium sp. NAS80.1]|nr:hypothetical protein AC629_43100 [Bradyrhizobium sp. NAS80.1]
MAMIDGKIQTPTKRPLDAVLCSQRMSCPYEGLRIRLYIHQNFPADDLGISEIKVMQARPHKLHHFIVRRISALPVLEYHHGDTDSSAAIQYIVRSESVRLL